MNATRRLSIAALIVACTHLVFGAIVRISGSGMGCGDNWPKCYGYWIPPFSRPDLIVEVSHRYLASILTLTVLTMAIVAFRNRRVAGIGGKGGVLRSALGAVAAVFTAAILGGVTVKMGNAPWATVAHWLVAMTLLAMVATTAIRAGALGGASSLVQRGSDRAKRSAFAAAVLAIFAVAFGGLTAKIPGAAVGCTTIPLCGPNPSVEPVGVHVQLTHRTIAVLLVLHLIGVVMMLRKRRATEAPVVARAAHVALGMVLLQLVVASSMILFHLPPVLRSLHEATGVGIWLSCFMLAYLARRASQVGGSEAASLASSPVAPMSPTSIVPTPAVPSMPSTSRGGVSTTGSPVSAVSNSVVRATEVLVGSSAFVLQPIEEAPLVVDPSDVDPISVSDGVIEGADASDEIGSVSTGQSLEVSAASLESIATETASDEVHAADSSAASDLAGVNPQTTATVVTGAAIDPIEQTLIVAAPAELADVLAPSNSKTIVEAQLGLTPRQLPDASAVEEHQAQLNGDACLGVSAQSEFGGAPRADAADSTNHADIPQPPVIAPLITPLPPRPKHTMAVIIARGADL